MLTVIVTKLIDSNFVISLTKLPKAVGMLTYLPNWLVWNLHDDFLASLAQVVFINSIILLYSALIGFDSHFCPLIVSLPIRGLLFPHVRSRDIPLGYSSTCYWRWRSPICVFYNPIGNLIPFQPFSRVIFREDAKVSCPLSTATISLFWTSAA